MTFSLNAFSQNKKTPNKSKSEKDQAISFHKYDISLIRLISTPEKYDGKQIQVIGYLNLEFEGDAIYLHKEDFSKGISDNGFWVNFSKQISQKKNLNEYNKKYVIIVGTFDMNSRGHMGMFGGTIKNITRLDLWNFDR
ncbi:hypothetical protein NU08_1345 [Flavobacterium anhuiense]|uniref:Uncharacterized protein n=1 Tax=Flavobacterium anhuiense TaxID=459526 RepID=A0A444W1U0_9FLAO|nr:hypothetical protein [Flavobacterium anhuiense]RYJ39676.1 hypothetical protein NU08_1345 [Flavobacterium anhuiense]